MKEKIVQIRQGAFDLVVVSDERVPVCFIAIRAMGSIAQMTIGHIRQASEYATEAVFRTAINTLIDRGFQSILSVFKWPEPGAFIRAAGTIGFVRVDRVDMYRECGTPCATGQLPAGIRIIPWSPAYFEDIARLLFESVYSEDRIINPLSRTPDGCRTHLRNIVDHLYGELLTGLSFIALREDRPVGVLLSSAWSDNALIVELAVDGDSRGRGIAGAMIGRLIEAGAAAGKAQVRLTVTASNRIAFDLYSHKGFIPGATVGYYIYAP